MKAVIMAGGMGSRLRPLTDKIPKPMVNIIDKPVAEYIVELLKKHGITDIAMTLCYRPSVIMRYFGDGSKWGVKISYFIEESPLGTAGSVKNAQKFLDEDFVVISGDAFTNIDLTSLIDMHYNAKAQVTIATKSVDDVTSFGVVATDGSGLVTQFVEKPLKSDIRTVNTGIYVMDKSVLDMIPKGVFYDFSKQLFPRMKGSLYAFECNCYWSDIGTLSSYYLTNNDVAVNAALFGVSL